MERPVAQDASDNRYKLEITSAARRDLKRLLKSLPSSRYTRLDGVIRSLEENPRPHGYEPVVNEENIFRCRDGDFRILYSIDDSRLRIRIARVRDRKDVYRH